MMAVDRGVRNIMAAYSNGGGHSQSPLHVYIGGSDSLTLAYCIQDFIECKVTAKTAADHMYGFQPQERRETSE
jgi:hypothetical protein